MLYCSEFDFDVKLRVCLIDKEPKDGVTMVLIVNLW